MIKKSVNRFKKGLGLLGLGILLSACNGNDARISFDVGSNYNFGSVVITKFKTATFKLSNISESPVVLETISDQSLGLSGEFSLIEGTCTSGLELGIGASCSMVVEYAPVNIGEKFETLKVQFKDKNKNEVHSEELILTGRGEIDCSVSKELAEKYNTGSQDAQTKNVSDTQKGTADGQALTYDNGKTDGISSAYQVGYQKGYYSANGHDAGYTVGYQEGKAAGLDSLSSCQNGALAGDYLGKTDGKEDGEFEGYDDGYFAGKSDGFDKGHYDGYLKGKATCSIRSQEPNPQDNLPIVRILNVVQNRQALVNLGQFEKLCYERGFSETRKANAYNDAYNRAKSVNTQYQSGYTAGYSIGYSQGEVTGIKEGFNKGRSVGFYDGEKLGKEIVYNSCYASGYEKAYKYWYAVYYDSSFDVGFDHGYDDGYKIGFPAGEKEGCLDADAINESAPSELLVRGPSYGKDQSFIRTTDGVSVVAHAQNDFSSHALSALIDPARKAELEKSINLYRGSMREFLSKEKIRAKIVLPKKAVVIKK